MNNNTVFIYSQVPQENWPQVRDTTQGKQENETQKEEEEKNPPIANKCNRKQQLIYFIKL